MRRWRRKARASHTWGARPASSEHDVARCTHLRRGDFAAWAGEGRWAYRQYGRGLRRTHAAKAPGPSGCTAAATRGVAALARCPRIALRAAPGGLARCNATQAG